MAYKESRDPKFPCSVRSRCQAPSTVASLVVAALVLACPLEARAQEHGEETVVVTVRGSSAGSFTSRTSTDTAPREPIDAASMIAELPSVHVRRLGGDGAFAALSIRGSASTQVGVVLGGIPLTGAADPSFDVSALPLWPGASFRVHRGFAPASLGTSGYLGGVLVIEPPSAAVGERTEWWALAGSFGALKLRAGDVRRVGDLTLGTGIYGARSDGDFSFERPVPATGGVVPATRTNAGHAAAGGIERITLSRPWGSVGLTLLVDARRRGLPGTALFPTRFASLSSSRLAAGLEAKIRGGSAGAWHLAGWGRRDTTTFRDPFGEVSPTRPDAFADDAIEAVGGSVGWRGRPWEAWTIDVFVDGRGERFVPLASRFFEQGSRASRIAGGAGAELEWRPGDRWIVAATGRVDGRLDDATGARGARGAELGSSGEVAPSGHLGATLKLVEGASLSAHAGALQRPPSFVELYGDRGALLGDPELRSERAFSADLGIVADVDAPGAALSLEVVGFATSAEDLISFVPLGRGTLIAKNVERAALAGLEVSAAAAGPRLRTSVSYTLLHTENLSDDPLMHGQHLPGRPTHDLACDVAYRVGRIRLRYGLDAVAGTTVDTSGTVVLPARVLHGAGASFDLPEFGAGFFRAGLTVENLFDLRTLHVQSSLGAASVPVPLSDFFGFPLPGRAVFATLRYVAGSPSGASADR
jgi:iron complex outermembrane receptor protein